MHCQLHTGQKWNLHKSKITLLVCHLSWCYTAAWLLKATATTSLYLAMYSYFWLYETKEETKEGMRGRGKPEAKNRKSLGTLLVICDIYIYIYIFNWTSICQQISVFTSLVLVDTSIFISHTFGLCIPDTFWPVLPGLLHVIKPSPTMDLYFSQSHQE